MYSIKWEESALKEVEKLDRTISLRIFKKIDLLRESHDSLDIKKLKGCDKYRLRVGDYRVIFSAEENNVIIIWKIGHRKNTYNKF